MSQYNPSFDQPPTPLKLNTSSQKTAPYKLSKTENDQYGLFGKPQRAAFAGNVQHMVTQKELATQLQVKKQRMVQKMDT
jgi:hypothetical protein